VLTVMFTYLHNQFVYFKHFITASFVSPREMGFLGVIFIFFVFVDANVFNIDLDFAYLNRESQTRRLWTRSYPSLALCRVG
jgi:hypothetical protein